jgi:hypothetical protein
MAGAADFMVGNAPNGANFAAPLLGFGIGDRLAALTHSTVTFACIKINSVALASRYRVGLIR